MFENRVLRRIFGPKRDEVTGECRKLDNDLLNDTRMYSLPSNVQVIKWRIVRWAGHVACMGESRVVYMVLVVQPVERDHLENPGVYGRKILRRIFRKWVAGAWTGSIWFGIQTGGTHL
jgi:hypothetical protein